MENLSGSYNPTFEMNEVDLTEDGQTKQIPNELSKPHHDQHTYVQDHESLPDKKTKNSLSVEDGLSDVTSPYESKYNTEQIPDGVQEDYSLLSFFNKNGPIGRFNQFLHKNKLKMKYISKIVASVLSLLAYVAYFIAVLIIKTEKESENYWCDSDGLLVVITCVVIISVIYSKILKPLFHKMKPKICIDKRMISIMESFSKIYQHRYTSPVMYTLVIGGIAIFLIIDTTGERDRLISAFGILVFILFGFLFSTAPRKIIWRHVIWGMGLQFILGLIILRWPVGRSIFKCLGDKVHTFLLFTDRGSSFIFGSLLVTELSVIAFKILSVILFLSLIIQILYYYGIMQWIVFQTGWLLQISMGTTACESVNAAANIFLGMSEAPLIIKPYLPLMTQSELHAVMTGGFSTIAGSVLAAYISFGVNPAHLLSASVMSAPAALAFSKLFYPEVEKSLTTASDIKTVDSPQSNVLHAAVEGVSESIPLVANIAANLIAFIAFIAFVDAVLSWPCDLLGLAEGTCTLSDELLKMRGKILELKEACWSIRNIAIYIGISKNTQICVFPENVYVIAVEAMHPEKQDQQIVEYMRQHTLSHDVKGRDELRLNIHARIVRDKLHASNIHYRTPIIKQYLRGTNKACRLLFVQQFADVENIFWNNVIFSDKKTFR